MPDPAETSGAQQYQPPASPTLWIAITLVLLALILLPLWLMPKTLYQNRLVTDYGGASFGEQYEKAEKIGTTYGLLRVFSESKKGELRPYDDKTYFLGMPWRFVATIAITVLIVLFAFVVSRSLYRKRCANDDQALLAFYQSVRNDPNAPDAGNA